LSLGHIVSTIILLTVVGAIIGGATNHIAIKMLFKPYYPVMIGKWRLPFTPGLIPKRHDEIAQELGKMVMKHLITAEGLKLKLHEKGFVDQISEYVKLQINQWLSSDATIRDRLALWADPNEVVSNLEEKLSTWLSTRIDAFFSSKADVVLGDILPEGLLNRAEEQLPEFASYITSSLAKYLESDEGKETVTAQLNQMFEGKGFFGNMLGLFLGNQSIVDKLYPELISFLSRPSFVMVIENLLRKEWGQWLGQSFGEVAKKVDLQVTGKTWVMNQLMHNMPIRQGLELKPRELFEDLDGVIEKGVSKGVPIVLGKLSENISDVLRTLDLEALVAEQVRQFSIQELEDVVLLISKKEFKMITYLGALLGGLIGIIQAVIVIGMG
jgi:uncharacterized membrane protein YheB (UPF0754 family)